RDPRLLALQPQHRPSPDRRIRANGGMRTLFPVPASVTGTYSGFRSSTNRSVLACLEDVADGDIPRGRSSWRACIAIHAGHCAGIGTVGHAFVRTKADRRHESFVLAIPARQGDTPGILRSLSE